MNLDQSILDVIIACVYFYLHFILDKEGGNADILFRDIELNFSTATQREQQLRHGCNLSKTEAFSSKITKID